MQRVSLAMVTLLVAAVMTGVGAAAQTDSSEEAAAAEADDVIFIDGDRARIDPDYRVQIGRPTHDGRCVRDPGQAFHIRVSAPVKTESSDDPPGLGHTVSTVGYRETESPCVFDVETYDYTGQDAARFLAGQGYPTWAPER